MNSIELEAKLDDPASTIRLKLEHVRKSFKGRQSGVLALDNVSFEVKVGEFVCLVGPSGCGKSTLFNLIAGLEKADSGNIQVNGQSVNSPGPDRLILFQEPALFPWLNVLSNVEFGLESIGIKGKERREIAMHYLKMVHLQNFAKFRVHQLSGGMRQRVAIARALAMNPEILLMDEPFTALDAQTRDMLHQELQQIWQQTGKTILFVTHNVREAVTLGDRVIVFTFRPGRVKSEFSTEHLPRPRHIESNGVVELVREINVSLKNEVDLAVAAEFHGTMTN